MAKKKNKMPSDGRRLEYLPLEDLKPAKRNPKDHDLGAIGASVTRFGFVEPIVLDERTGRLVAGHGRTEDLKNKLKATPADPPDGVKVGPNGEWLVPVIRGWSSADDHEAHAYGIAANRSTELGGWLMDQLGESLAELAAADQLEGTGYDRDDVDDLLKDLGKGPGSDGSDADELPPTPERPWVTDGDLFELGPHRLLVGDTFKAEDRARLFGLIGADARAQVKAVITDPPYAIYGSATGIGSDIADDKMVRPFFENLLRIAFDLLPLFGQAYLFCDWRTYPAIWECAKRAGLAMKNKIVWDKGGSGLGNNWANSYEEVAYMVRAPPAKAMKSTETITGMRAVLKPNLQRFPRPHGDERLHNAAKPVGLCREIVDAATDSGDLVFEPFGGGGSTLIACEELGRPCRVMEIEPKFAQVILERWEKRTGSKALKLPAPEPVVVHVADHTGSEK